MGKSENKPSPAARRRFLSIFLSIISAAMVGERTWAATKTPPKKILKKPVKKVPVKKAPAKPVANVSAKPSPSVTPSSSPSASPSPSASAITSASPSPSTSASPSATVAPVNQNPPIGAKELSIAGKKARISDFAIGSTILADYPKDGGRTTLFVTRLDENKFVGFKPLCTHAGGPLELAGGSLLCSWHFSRFNQRTGDVIVGPASEALREENVQIYGEMLYYI